MTTDTAKKLIEMSEPVAVAFYQPVMMDGKPLNMVTSLTPLPTADLQAMAKLWLMRDEICSHLDPHDPTRADIERLEEK
jgi:hypothetical protein